MTSQRLKCIRVFVSGKVQGVFFRSHTGKIAERVGIIGHARNLADKRVEVYAIAEAAILKDFVRYLHIGSPLARVTNVEVNEESLPDELPDEFSTH